MSTDTRSGAWIYIRPRRCGGEGEAEASVRRARSTRRHDMADRANGLHRRSAS